MNQPITKNGINAFFITPYLLTNLRFSLHSVNSKRGMSLLGRASGTSSHRSGRNATERGHSCPQVFRAVGEFEQISQGNFPVWLATSNSIFYLDLRTGMSALHGGGIKMRSSRSPFLS